MFIMKPHKHLRCLVRISQPAANKFYCLTLFNYEKNFKKPFTYNNIVYNKPTRYIAQSSVYSAAKHDNNYQQKCITL